MEPKYPDITVELVGHNGNAFSVIGRVSQALRRSKVSAAEIKQYQTESMSGDYDNVLQTAMKWVTVE